MSSLTFPLNLFRPEKKESEPFHLTIYSNIEKMFTLPKTTALSESADDFIMEAIGSNAFFRKKFLIAVCKTPKIPIAMLDVVEYNIPLLLSKGYNMGALVSDATDDKLNWLENRFLASITDKNGMPNSRIFKPSYPILYMRALSVIPSERGKGIGGYLFRSVGDYLRGLFGLGYVSIFAPAGYTFITNAEIVETQNVSDFIETQQKIVLKWLKTAGFKEYVDGDDGRFFVRHED